MFKVVRAEGTVSVEGHRGVCCYSAAEDDFIIVNYKAMKLKDASDEQIIEAANNKGLLAEN